jgi:hypothetical protein
MPEMKSRPGVDHRDGVKDLDEVDTELIPRQLRRRHVTSQRGDAA